MYYTYIFDVSHYRTGHTLYGYIFVLAYYRTGQMCYTYISDVSYFRAAFAKESSLGRTIFQPAISSKRERWWTRVRMRLRGGGGAEFYPPFP